LKHRFHDFAQVAFWAGQEEENEFPCPGDHLKNRLLDLTQDAFVASEEAQNEFKVSWISSNSLSQHHTNRILGG